MNRVTDASARQEYYRVLTRESERLARLIDNVLDFSRIEGGRQRYDILPSAIEPLVQEVLEAFRYPLTQESFKVQVDLESDLPEVPLDAEAIKQALANPSTTRSLATRDLTVSARRVGRRCARGGGPGCRSRRPRPSESSSSSTTDGVRRRRRGVGRSAWSSTLSRLMRR
jgi:hypothetical protein